MLIERAQEMLHCCELTRISKATFHFPVAALLQLGTLNFWTGACGIC